MSRPRATIILQALVEAGGHMTTAQLAKRTGVPQKQVSQTCERLRMRGLIEKPEKKGVFAATKAGRETIAAGQTIKSGPCAPHTGKRMALDTLRTRAWRAMKILQRFTAGDLETVAKQGGERDPLDNIRRYLLCLERAGYLRRLRAREAGTAPTSNGSIRYIVVQHTGRKAPILLKGRTRLYDPNTGETHDAGAKR